MDTTPTIVTSKKFTLDWRDLGMGALIAAISPILFALQQAGDMVLTQHKTIADVHLDWRYLLMAALSGGVSFLIKKFFEASKTIIQPPLEVKETIVQPTDSTTSPQ